MDHDMFRNGDTSEDPLSMFDYEKHRVLKYAEISKFAIEDPGYRIDDEQEEEMQSEKSMVMEVQLPDVSVSNSAKRDVHTKKDPFTIGVPQYNKFLLLNKTTANNEKVCQNQTTRDKLRSYDASITNSNDNCVGRNLNKYIVSSDKLFTAGCTVSSFPESNKKPKKIGKSKSLKNSFKYKASKQDIIQSSKPTTMNSKVVKICDENCLCHLKEKKDCSTSAFVANAEKTKHMLSQAKKIKDKIKFKELAGVRDNNKDLSMEIGEQQINHISIDHNSVSNLSVLPNIKPAAISKARRNTISSCSPYTSAFNVCDQNVYNHNKIIPHYHKLRINHIKTSNKSESNEDHNGLAEVIIKNVRSESMIPKTTYMEGSMGDNINTANVNTENPQIRYERNFSFIPVLLNKNIMPTKNDNKCGGQRRTKSLHGRDIQENKNMPVIQSLHYIKNDDKNNNYAVSRNIIPVLVSGNVHSVQHNQCGLSVQNNAPNRSTQGLITNNCDHKSPQSWVQFQQLPYYNSNNTPRNNPNTSINSSINLSCNVNKSVPATNLYYSTTSAKPQMQCASPISPSILYINSSGMPSNVLYTNNLSLQQPQERACDSNTTTQNQKFKTNKISDNREIFNAAKVKSVDSKVRQLVKLRQRNLRTKSCDDYTSKHPAIVRVLESPVIHNPLRDVTKMYGVNNLNKPKSDVKTITPKTEYSAPILPILSYETILNIISKNKIFDFCRPHLLQNSGESEILNKKARS